MAALLGRTPSALTMKLCNLARFDETLQARNVGGLANGSRMDKDVWDEFYGKTAALAVENAKLLEKLKHASAEDIPPGMVKEDTAFYRIGQDFFRNAILSNYEGTCCMTGIAVPRLLIASHIKPWVDATAEEKTNPANGLCLNALHDRAFDQGLITVATDYTIHVSSELKRSKKLDDMTKRLIMDRDGEKIILPHRFQPSREFLEYHNDAIFMHG